MYSSDSDDSLPPFSSLPKSKALRPGSGESSRLVSSVCKETAGDHNTGKDFLSDEKEPKRSAMERLDRVGGCGTEGEKEDPVSVHTQEKRKAAVARKAERERQRNEKKHQKEMDKALKKATVEANKENTPSERVKQMIVVLDTVLSESGDFMVGLVRELKEMGVEYRVGRGHPGSVMWKRRINERTVGDDTQIVCNVKEKDENQLLVTLPAQEFVGLVHYTKQAQHGVPLPPGAQTLQQYVEGLQLDHPPGITVTLAVEGLDTFFRGKKTQFNRKFRQAVTGTAASTATTSASDGMFSDVTRVDCEEALVGLQLAMGCGVRMCTNGAELAEYVVTLTKSLADLPFKKESPFSFHTESGAGASKKTCHQGQVVISTQESLEMRLTGPQALQETDNKVALVWKHQLMQFNNISDHMAAAIVAVYPSPAHLLREYESTDRRTSELLLQDILIRRGVGTVASTRRLGPVQSKRIHTLLTSQDPSVTLT